MGEFASYPSLKGRTVFVTGGATGIGAAFVQAFNGQGGRVAFVDLNEAAGQGPITVLINSVANDTRQVAAEVTPQIWRETLAVNLDPAFIAATAVYPMMKAAGGGAIVNVSSINATTGHADLAAYSAAKGAINALTKSLALAWGVDRIRVNALSPGWVITPRQTELWLTPQAEAEWTKLAALKDRIMPEDIARAALFLASGDSRMMTGQNLVVDAGRT
jgi:NAD(P)-dependent dehydrogenase (short-subunit alcohol dehydrogenase family)